MDEGPSVSPDEPTVADFAYGDFYKAISEYEQLQVTREEAMWLERFETPTRPVDVLLNFGCNVRKTPHLQREAVAVLEVLGVDFAAVAGQQFCCGKPYSNEGFAGMGRQVVERSVSRMAAFQPKRTIQWCSACEMQFRDVVVPEVGIEFQSDGFAAFLVERIDELGEAMPWQGAVPTKALVHGHLGEHAVRDAHPAISMELLKRIPGVELVGLADTPALDLCDNAGPAIASITSEEYRAAQGALEGYLSEAGAETLVTLYHSCTRELSKFASERLEVRHYVSILAEALGVAKPDRFSEYWRLGDPKKVVEASSANWQSWNISEQEALRLAHKYFVPSYAADVPDCPCNGQCTRTGAIWMSPYKITQGAAAR